MSYPALIAYLVLVLAVCCKPEELIKADARDAAAALCAIASTCALPWGGVSFLCAATPHNLSILWFPLVIIAAATLRQRPGFAPMRKVALVVALILAPVSLSRFMTTVGTPGDLGSIEALSLIFKLPGIRDWRFVTGELALLAGLVLSFARAGFAEGSGASLLSFSFSGFLLNVFSPINQAVPSLLQPKTGLAISAALLLTLSVASGRLFCLAQRIPLSDARRDRALFPLWFAVVGCYLIVSSAG